MADSTLTMDERDTEAGGSLGGGSSIGGSSPGVAAARARVLAHRRSPAHDLVDEMRAGSGEAVQLREVPFLTQVAVRASSGSRTAQALGAALGLSLPTRAGEVAGAADGNGVAVLWLSPDEMLAVGPDEADSGVSPEVWVGELAEAVAGEPGQVVDVSANRTTLELSGPRALSVLQKSCELDLHPRAFAVGQAVATLLDSTGVILWRTGEETWRVLPRASFATHVVRWLLDGMREYR
ncbi:sarcosine oxidase subunit gamma family protein [Terrabacter sp. NPDC080008]|uniref:sarcosine oxidase subunit gamma n=1 Tax=Terrabacter sp. NPDC080008 TaxID=3155176 RepID=UPI00344F1D7F